MTYVFLYNSRQKGDGLTDKVESTGLEEARRSFSNKHAFEDVKVIMEFTEEKDRDCVYCKPV